MSNPLCVVCHEEVFPEEEIKIQGVPYHSYCYEDEFSELDEVSSAGGGGVQGYQGSAFTMNYPEEDEDELKEDDEKLDEEIKQKIDEMSTSGGISGYRLGLGAETGNKIIKDPYKKDRKGKEPRIDDDNLIRNDLATSGKPGYIKHHPINSLKDILKK